MSLVRDHVEALFCATSLRFGAPSSRYLHLIHHSSHIPALLSQTSFYNLTALYRQLYFRDVRYSLDQLQVAHSVS